jgi:hypothetical protein
MCELANKNSNGAGVSTPASTGPANLNYGTEAFLGGPAFVDFDVGLDFEGQLLQFH